jgi:hypothetical protein
MKRSRASNIDAAERTPGSVPHAPPGARRLRGRSPAAPFAFIHRPRRFDDFTLQSEKDLSNQSPPHFDQRLIDLGITVLPSQQADVAAKIIL